MLELSYVVEHWPIAGTFTIARGAKTEAVVVVVTVTDGIHTGRGEAVPYARYGETIDSVMAQISAVAPVVTDNFLHDDLTTLMPAGAARNAVDCALWDFACKSAGARAWALAGISAPTAVDTAYTISLAAPDVMFEKAQAAAHRNLLKIKLGTADDVARLEAVRHGAPNTKIIVDANEGWSLADLDAVMPALVQNGVVLIEQPLPAGADSALEAYNSPIPLCADESAHVTADVAILATKYQAINIKLDKCGGLTEALKMATAVEAAGLDIMIGCMVGTSLAMAPAMLIANRARYVDLDGPLLLAQDRENGLKFEGSLVHPPTMALWG
jgi:L-Ala-D/L-Glu epimerase